MSRQKTKALIVDVNKTILKDKVSPIRNVIDYVNAKFDEGYKIFLISGSHSARLRVMRIALARCGVKYHDLTLNDEGILLDGEYKRKYVKKQMQYYDVVQFIDNNEQHRNAVAILGVDVSAPDEIE